MEVMRLNSECMNCLLTHQLGKTPADVSEEKRVDYMQRVLKILSEANKQDSAPVIVRSIYRLQKEMFGMETDYTEIKRYYNQRMLEKAVSIEQGIEAREDPLKCAIQYAMTGNYIDFAALHTVEEDKLDVLLHKAEENLIDEEKGVYNEDGTLNINPNSLTVVQAKLEPALKDVEAYDSFQFVRNGFFCVDAKDSRPDALVFNRIVSLKSSFKLPKQD